MPKKQIILAHRGFSAKYPENTLLAFARAIEAGADGIECDLQLSKEKNVFILHDDSIDRTSNGKGLIKDLTAEDLLKYDFGSGEKIPTFEQLLSQIPKEAWVNLEIKKETFSLADCEQLIVQLKNKRNPKRTMISSFAHELLVPFKREGYVTGALLGEEHAGTPIQKLLFDLWRLGPSYINFPIQLFERLKSWQAYFMIYFFKTIQIKICFWTVNQQSEYQMIQNFSDMIITDDVINAQIWMK